MSRFRNLPRAPSIPRPLAEWVGNHNGPTVYRNGTSSQRLAYISPNTHAPRLNLDADIHSDDPFSLALVIGCAAIICVAIGLPMIGLSFRPKLKLQPLLHSTETA